MSKISEPNEAKTESAIIFRLLLAETNRFASGDSLVKRPTRGCLAGLVLLTDLPRLLTVGPAGNFEDALAALLGASGVTVEGAFGSPFAGVFFAGPGRFKLALEGL